jgi:histone H3/H4
MPKKHFAYDRCQIILSEAGARYAKPEAIEELRIAVENIALDISERAVNIAYENSRWKVNREDILNAVQELLGRKRITIISNKT